MCAWTSAVGAELPNLAMAGLVTKPERTLNLLFSLTHTEPPPHRPNYDVAPSLLSRDPCLYTALPRAVGADFTGDVR